jgi:hypothetical protein
MEMKYENESLDTWKLILLPFSDELRPQITGLSANPKWSLHQMSSSFNYKLI